MEVKTFLTDSQNDEFVTRLESQNKDQGITISRYPTNKNGRKIIIVQSYQDVANGIREHIELTFTERQGKNPVPVKASFWAHELERITTQLTIYKRRSPKIEELSHRVENIYRAIQSLNLNDQT